jgi:hypothetical protein
MESEKMTPALEPLLFAAPRTAPSILFQGLQAALEAGVQLGPVEGNGMGKRVPPVDNQYKLHRRP